MSRFSLNAHASLLDVTLLSSVKDSSPNDRDEQLLARARRGDQYSIVQYGFISMNDNVKNNSDTGHHIRRGIHPNLRSILLRSFGVHLVIDDRHFSRHFVLSLEQIDQHFSGYASKRAR